MAFLIIGCEVERTLQKWSMWERKINSLSILSIKNYLQPLSYEEMIWVHSQETNKQTNKPGKMYGAIALNKYAIFGAIYDVFGICHSY